MMRCALPFMMVCAGLLTACSNGGSPVAPAPGSGVAPAAAPLRDGARDANYQGTLLYATHAQKTTGGYYGALTAYEVPSGQTFSTVALTGFGTGLCADTSGNVWVVVSNDKQHIAYEYAHGGTKPIAKIRIGYAEGVAGGCAVDPTTGSIAVVEGIYSGSGGGAAVEVWPSVHAKPTKYPIDFTPTACVYDGSGNLFVDGYVGSTVLFELQELAKGGASFARLRLDKGGGFYSGGLGWDGTYLDVVTKGGGRNPALYRAIVSGSKAHVVDVIKLHKLYYASPVAIEGGMVAGASGREYGHTLTTWGYPQGGKATTHFARYQGQVAGVAFSVAPTDSARAAEPGGCRVPRYYRFGGACTSGALQEGVTTYTLAEYRRIRASFQIPPTGTHRRYTFTFADATGDGDIGTFRGKTFPLYPNPCGDPTCPGTAFLYVGARLNGPSVLMTGGGNVFSYRTRSGYPGTTCGEAELMKDGKWYAFGESASPKGDRLTFDSAIDYRIGAFTIAVYCE